MNRRIMICLLTLILTLSFAWWATPRETVKAAGSLAAPATTACSNLSFNPATNFAAGSLPYSVAVGDFNGDSKLDLAVANALSNDVSVRLGDGAGGFGAATSFATGTTPASVAAGDLNGDGKLDLVTANNSSDNVSVLLGNGAGGFGAATNFAIAIGMTPATVVIADFNSDGKLDLVTANQNPYTNAVLLGDGAGGFGAATNYYSDTLAWSVAVGDFNSDGKLDLLTSDVSYNKVLLRLGDGAGSFGAATSFAVGTNPVSVVVGDFNGDGKLDLAVANALSNDVSVRLGDGAGGFSAAPTINVGNFPTSIRVGDFNGDGKLDLAIASYYDNNVSVRLGDGAGGFGAATSFATGTGPISVAAGDLNGDGKLDLVTANSASDDVSVLLSNCTANQPPTLTPVDVDCKEGNNPGSFPIASVDDPESGVNGVAVTVISANPSNGVTVSSILNTNGAVTAFFAASCGASDTSFALKATDGDGLSVIATIYVRVRPETTPPVVNCPTNVVAYLPLNSTATVMEVNYPPPTATDNCTASPIIQSSPASGSVFPLGTTTVNVTATDAAGNSSSCSFTVTVLYNFGGFIQPVDAPPIVNVVSAGQAVPVKFSLSGNKGLNIFAAGYPASQQIVCTSGTPSDIEETVGAGVSSLSYDLTTDRYTYVWKTERSWSGTCRRLVLKFNDGSTQEALFRFR